MKTILLNALVTATVIVSFLLAREAVYTWQRVNSLMVWANAQEQARRPAPPPIVQPETAKK